MLGQWQGPCAAGDDGRSELEVTATTFILSQVAFAANDCAGGEAARLRWEGPRTGGIALEDEVFEVEALFNKVFALAITEESAMEANDDMAFGFTDWAAGVEKDITAFGDQVDGPPFDELQTGIGNVTGNQLKLEFADPRPTDFTSEAITFTRR